MTTREQGAVAILVALMLPTVIVPILALSVDGAALYSERQDAQTAADAGALAAAQSCGNDDGEESSWPQRMADANVGIGVGTATSTGCGSGEVSVTVAVVGPAYFSGIFGATELHASATATASWEITQPVQPVCKVLVPRLGFQNLVLDSFNGYIASRGYTLISGTCPAFGSGWPFSGLTLARSDGSLYVAGLGWCWSSGACPGLGSTGVSCPDRVWGYAADGGWARSCRIVRFPLPSQGPIVWTFAWTDPNAEPSGALVRLTE